MIRTFEDTLRPEHAIPGVHFKQLKTFKDDRGFFRELVRASDPFFGEGFAQWSHSKMVKDTVKAWHFHHVQVDWWYVGLGVVHTVLFDNREESPTYRRKIEFVLGEPEEEPNALAAVVKIPQGVLHGCKTLSDTAHLFYITSQSYNPDDEGRYPYNSEIVPHVWGENVTTVENDRRLFMPTAPRTTLAR